MRSKRVVFLKPCVKRNSKLLRATENATLNKAGYVGAGGLRAPASLLASKKKLQKK